MVVTWDAWDLELLGPWTPELEGKLNIIYKEHPKLGWNFKNSMPPALSTLASKQSAYHNILRLHNSEPLKLENITDEDLNYWPEATLEQLQNAQELEAFAINSLEGYTLLEWEQYGCEPTVSLFCDIDIGLIQDDTGAGALHYLLMS